MTTYTNPQSVVLRTDVVRVPLSAWPLWMMAQYNPSGVFGPYLYTLADFTGSSWLSPSEITLTTNTVRTFDITNSGLMVTDSQETVAFSVTVGSTTSPTYDQTSWRAAINAFYAEYSEVSLVPSPPYDIPFSPTGGSAGGGTFPIFGSGGFVGGSYSIQDMPKLPGNKLLATINEGGIFDIEDGSALAEISGFSYDRAEYLQGFGADFLGPYGPYFQGIQGTSFGLLLDRPNVPLGTLICKALPQGVFPRLPSLTVASSTGGGLFVSAAADIASWGGWRYLKVKARVHGFSTAVPLPRTVLGIVPTSKLNEAACAAALAGEATVGVWYDVPVTEQGTTGQVVTIDLAHSIAGSVFTSLVDLNALIYASDPGEPLFKQLSPLGIGAWGVNIGTPPPGSVYSGFTVEPVSLVLAMDGSEVQRAETGSAPTIGLSDFQFIETTGSELVIRVNSLENLPMAPSNQPAGVDITTPTNGTLLTISRDGKPAVAVALSGGLDGRYGPTLDADAPPVGYEGSSGYLTWSEMISQLNALGNGYEWTFEPQYTNFMTGSEIPEFFLPVPTKFPPVQFKLGGSVSIPIKARCVNYSSSCPWVDLSQVIGGPISGDDPVTENKANVEILCLSDFIGPMTGIAMTVQSYVLGTEGTVALLNTGAPPSVPTLTDDYGPTILTPDVNGLITFALGPPSGWQTDSEVVNTSRVNGGAELGASTVTLWQYEVSPQIDGYAVSFDEGLAKGQSSESGTLVTVYVPVRNGQLPPIPYTPSAAGTVLSNEFEQGPMLPYLDRSTSAAFCLRAELGADTKYSEPRNAFWSIQSDAKNRIKASLLAGFHPFAAQTVKYPLRAGAFVAGQNPALAIYHAKMLAVYRRLDNKWAAAETDDQFTTLGAETLLFNQTITGDVSVEYDHSTGSQWYVASLRSDGLSWLTTPEASTNPGALPQVAVLRRRDGSGAFLPLVLAAGAGLAGPIWENVVYTDQPSGGKIGVQVLPTGIVVLTCGVNLYQSVDNGTSWTDQSGAAVQALTTQTSGELQSGANGGTQNP